jgi:hypothetical protein
MNHRSNLCILKKNNVIYAEKTNELGELWRPFPEAILNLFQCRQLHWISEVEQNTVRSEWIPFDVLFDVICKH